MSDHALASATRPYNQLTFAEACQRIAAAGYSDVAVFAHNQEMPSIRAVRLTRSPQLDRPPQTPASTPRCYWGEPTSNSA